MEELLILYARVQFYTPRVSDYRLISKTANTAWVHASFVNYKKKCTGLASDKVYLLLAHGRWFSPGNPEFKEDLLTCGKVNHLFL
jgi:hypothetical protein